MSDLLIKLYALPQPTSPQDNITVRRAFAAERWLVCDWVTKRFGPGWASECEASFARLPVACSIAVRDGDLLGFACYDATARGLFGPTGVAGSETTHFSAGQHNRPPCLRRRVIRADRRSRIGKKPRRRHCIVARCFARHGCARLRLCDYWPAGLSGILSQACRRD